MRFCRRKLGGPLCKAVCSLGIFMLIGLATQNYLLTARHPLSHDGNIDDEIIAGRNVHFAEMHGSSKIMQKNVNESILFNQGNYEKVILRPPVVLDQNQKLSFMANRVPPGYFLLPISGMINEQRNLVGDQVIAPEVYRNDKAALQKYISYLKKTEEPLPLQTRAVILLTNFRSGSSFFGELLNQHPDVFYVFEPLILVSQLYRCDDDVAIKKQILKDLSQCNTPNWMQIYAELPHQTRPRLTRNIFTCNRKKFCFAPFTQELCAEEHCPRANTSAQQKKREHDCWDDCGVVNVNLVNNLCRRKRLVAIKVIRFCHLHNLEDLVTQHHIDLKVVHLVRDPRAIATSRHSLNRRLNIMKSMAFTCNRLRNNADLGMLERPPWLEGRYKMFRYEDVALRPYEAARELYEYLDLPFPGSVKEWIYTNTMQPIQADNLSKENHSAAFIRGGANKRSASNTKSLQDPWGHTRNSRSVVQKWRRQMPYFQAKDIDSVCGDIMRQAGYIPVGGAPDYYNLSVRLFTDRLP